MNKSNKQLASDEHKEVTVATAKLDQMIHLFYLSLPHEEAKSKGWTVGGLQFLSLMEEVFTSIKENFKRNPESMASYMFLLRDCMNYVLEEDPYWPEQEGRDNHQAILDYLQRRSFTSHPKKNPVNLIEEDGKIKGVVNDEYFNLSKKK